MGDSPVWETHLYVNSLPLWIKTRFYKYWPFICICLVPFCDCLSPWAVTVRPLRSSSTSPTLPRRATSFSCAGRTRRWRNASSSCRRWWLKWYAPFGILGIYHLYKKLYRDPRQYVNTSHGQ
jgi:hypothetical protein